MSDHIAIAIREDRDILNMFRGIPYIRVYPMFPELLEMNVQGCIGECAICQEDFRVGETFVPLPCNDTHPHKFHKKCIDPWVRRHNTCPVCRGTIR